jgi:hypothetical protein
VGPVVARVHGGFVRRRHSRGRCRSTSSFAARTRCVKILEPLEAFAVEKGTMLRDVGDVVRVGAVRVGAVRVGAMRAGVNALCAVSIATVGAIVARVLSRHEGRYHGWFESWFECRCCGRGKCRGARIHLLMSASTRMQVGIGRTVLVGTTFGVAACVPETSSIALLAVREEFGIRLVDSYAGVNQESRPNKAFLANTLEAVRARCIICGPISHHTYRGFRVAIVGTVVTRVLSGHVGRRIRGRSCGRECWYCRRHIGRCSRWYSSGCRSGCGGGRIGRRDSGDAASRGYRGDIPFPTVTTVVIGAIGMTGA